MSFARFAFQACSFNHSDISPFRIAFGRAFTRKVATMIELRTESSIDFREIGSCW